MDEARLISDLLSGVPQAVDTLRSWFRKASVPYRERLAAELEDLEQDVILALTEQLEEGRFEGRSSLQTYVRTLTHHKCIDRLRSLSRRHWIDISSLDLPSGSASALDRLSDEDDFKLALLVVELMPESCRELWRLLEKGLRYREMSEILGIGEGALRGRVLRCRQRALEIRRQLLAEQKKP